jgi:hypothetical protein
VKRHYIEILRLQTGKKDNVCVVELLEAKHRYYIYVSLGKRTADQAEQIMYLTAKDFESAEEAFNSEVKFKHSKGYQLLAEGAHLDFPWFSSLPGTQKAPKVFRTSASEEHRKLSV